MYREKIILIAKEVKENPKTYEMELVTSGTYELSGAIVPLSTQERSGIAPEDLIGATSLLKAYLPYSTPKFFPGSHLKTVDGLFETVGDVETFKRGRRTKHKEVLVRRVHG